MRRSIIVGIAALGLLASCKGNDSTSGGFGQKSNGQQQDPVKAAQSQSADALSRASTAQKDAQSKQDTAQNAQKSVADAQKHLTDAQAKAEQQQQQAQSAQQKALTKGQQASQVASQAGQQAAQAQAAQAQTQQQDAAKQQASSAPASGATATETGKLVQVSGDTLLLDRGDKGQLPVSTDASTQVTIDGRQAAMNELKPGNDVRVAYQPGSGGQVKAQRIEATSTPASTPTSPGSTAPTSGQP
jgi:hypothetical protein